jgi:hypothetical protein
MLHYYDECFPANQHLCFQPTLEPILYSVLGKMIPIWHLQRSSSSIVGGQNWKLLVSSYFTMEKTFLHYRKTRYRIYRL